MSKVINSSLRQLSINSRGLRNLLTKPRINLRQTQERVAAIALADREKNIVAEGVHPRCHFQRRRGAQSRKVICNNAAWKRKALAKAIYVSEVYSY